MRLFEDRTLIARHPILKGRNRRRVDPGHRRPPPPRTDFCPTSRRRRNGPWPSTTPWDAASNGREQPDDRTDRPHRRRPRRTENAPALEALGPTLQRLEQGEITAVEAIDALLSEDCALRETRRIDIALRTAKLLPVKTVESFDFTFQPSLDRERIAALAQLDFIGRRETVHFLGPPGTGKSHLATALGVAAAKAGKSVYKTTLAEPVEPLAKAERQSQLAEKIRFFARAAILIVDEIGCLPIFRGGASLFFQIVNASCEKGAMILTSNRSFAEWGDIFGDPVVATALLDRLHHHAAVVRIEGASYRLRKHADLIPEHVRTNAPITPPPPKKRGRPKKETRTDD